jgi:hypothetical protein
LFWQHSTSAWSQKTANSAGSSTNKDTASSCLFPPPWPYLPPALRVTLELSLWLPGHRHQCSHCPNCPQFLLQDGNARCGMKLTNEGARMCIIFILPSSALC